MELENLLIIDAGTTFTKVLLALENEKLFYKFESKTEQCNKTIESLYIKYNIRKIIMFGSGAANILIKDKSVNLITYSELEVIAAVAPLFHFSEALIVSMGTGTSVSYYKDKEQYHISGTGIAGRTLQNLGELLLGEPLEKLEQLAQNGDISKINLLVGEAYDDSISWLSREITASNFAKKSSSKEDIALGLYYLITEPVISILHASLSGKEGMSIVFCGGVSNSGIVRNIIKKYALIYGYKLYFCKNGEFIPCLSAYRIFTKKDITGLNLESN
jgi:pantothenate kinase